MMLYSALSSDFLTYEYFIAVTSKKKYIRHLFDNNGFYFGSTICLFILTIVLIYVPFGMILKHIPNFSQISQLSSKKNGISFYKMIGLASLGPLLYLPLSYFYFKVFSYCTSVLPFKLRNNITYLNVFLVWSSMGNIHQKQPIPSKGR